jgi:hypothetical protein
MEHIQYVRELAQTHGFRLAGLRSFDRPITEEACAKAKQLRLAGKMVQDA